MKVLTKSQGTEGTNLKKLLHEKSLPGDAFGDILKES